MSYTWSNVKVCVWYRPAAAAPSSSNAAGFSVNVICRSDGSTRTTFRNGCSPDSSRGRGGRTRMTTLKLRFMSSNGTMDCTRAAATHAQLGVGRRGTGTHSSLARPPPSRGHRTARCCNGGGGGRPRPRTPTRTRGCHPPSNAVQTWGRGRTRAGGPCPRCPQTPHRRDRRTRSPCWSSWTRGQRSGSAHQNGRCGRPPRRVQESWPATAHQACGI